MPPLSLRLIAIALVGLTACAPPLAPAPPAAVPTPKPTSAPSPVERAPAAPPTAANAPLASDAVAESLLVDVAKVDSTIRVELRYATPYNFTGAIIPGYEASHALLRREAAAALGRVQERLRAESLGVKIFDAYRPVRASDAMVAWSRRVGRDDLVREGYVSERSRHNLGLAVDVTLVDLTTGRELKMGSTFDTFATTARTANAAGDVATNRQRLKRAMEAEGFTSVPEEWWHFGFEAPRPMRFDLVIR